MKDVTIYHNPRCSKSRQTLALLEEKGHKPVVVTYLDTPPDADTLKDIIAKLGVPLIDIVRTGETEFQKDMPNWSDAKLIDEIIANPILIQRPIVVADGQARIGRPPESVLEILS